MAFKTRWECEYCGHVIWAVEEPEDYDCPNYGQETLKLLKGNVSEMASAVDELCDLMEDDPQTVQYECSLCGHISSTPEEVQMCSIPQKDK